MSDWKLDRRQPSTSAPFGSCIICAIPFDKETPKIACYDCFIEASADDKEALTQLSIPRKPASTPAPIPANLKLQANGVTASLTVLPKAKPTMAEAFARSRKANPTLRNIPKPVIDAVASIKIPGVTVSLASPKEVKAASQSVPASQPKTPKTPSLFSKVISLVNQYPTLAPVKGANAETPSQTRERMEAMAFAEGIIANRDIPETEKPSVAIAVARAWLTLDATQQRFILLELD